MIGWQWPMKQQGCGRKRCCSVHPTINWKDWENPLITSVSNQDVPNTLPEPPYSVCRILIQGGWNSCRIKHFGENSVRKACMQLRVFMPKTATWRSMLLMHTIYFEQHILSLHTFCQWSGSVISHLWQGCSAFQEAQFKTKLYERQCILK
jgi:hypothetical protein